MIKTIAKPKPLPDPAIARTQLIVSPVKKKQINFLSQRPAKGPVRVDTPGKVAFQADVMSGEVVNRRATPTPSKLGGDGKRKFSLGRKPTSGRQAASYRSTTQYRPQQSSSNTAAIIVGVIFLFILLIIGIVALNSKPSTPVQYAPATPVAGPEPDRSMKEWMDQHGGGSQALKERQERRRHAP